MFSRRLTFTGGTLCVICAVAGFIGSTMQAELWTPDPAPPECRPALVTSDRCTVPADRGRPIDLPDWAADELLDLRLDVAKLRAERSLRQSPPLPHYVVPDTGERGES